jgi:hypothetical protein
VEYTCNQPEETPPVEFFTDEEAAALFEKIAQRYLGISGEEFIRRWDSGYYGPDADRPGVMDVAMSLPLVRR